MCFPFGPFYVRSQYSKLWITILLIKKNFHIIIYGVAVNSITGHNTIAYLYFYLIATF